MKIPEVDLFPHVLKAHAAAGLARPYSIIVHPDRAPDVISFGRLNQAVDRASWFLEEHLAGVKTFAYLGKSDTRYTVWVLAASKTGRVAALPSPKNTPAANLALLRKMNATAVVYDPDTEAAGTFDAQFAAFRAAGGIQILPGLGWDVAMDETTAVPEFPFTATYDEAKHRHFMAAHTSGTSGNPKPIYMNTTYYKIREQFEQPHPERFMIVSVAGREEGHESYLFSTLPFNHMAGVYWTIWALFLNFVLVVPHPDVGLTAETIDRMVLPEVDCFFTVPVILKSMMEHPGCVERIRRFRHLVTCAAPVETTLGNAVKALNPAFQTMYGTTEMGVPNQMISARWDGFRLPVYDGSRFDEVMPGAYEYVVTRAGRGLDYYSIFDVFPDLDEFRSKDLYRRVEEPGGDDDSQSRTWAYIGRADEWIVMSNGYKYDPAPMQRELMGTREIRGALVAGTGRFAPCLLVELSEPEQQKHELGTAEGRARALDEVVWPIVKEANRRVAKFGRVPRELVQIVPAGQTMSWTQKGTVMRLRTVELFQAEIDMLYRSNESSVLAQDLPPIRGGLRDGLIPVLQAIYAAALDTDGPLGPDEDVFNHGTDSSIITIVRGRVRAALRAHGGFDESKLQLITMQTLFSNQTIRRLAGALADLLDPTSSGSGEAAADPARDVHDLLDEFLPLVELAPPASAREPKQSEKLAGPQTVLLTGTTGSLGSYLLAAFLAQPRSRVAHVYCVNRSAAGPGTDPATRQAAALQSRGLGAADPDRVTFLAAEFGVERLGLGEATWSRLESEVTLVIHNAWAVNFLLPAATFRPHLATLAHLLALSHAAAAPLFFVSSISTGFGDPWGDGTTHEAVHTRPQRLLDQGYARSKYVGERMVQAFARSTGLRAEVLRVGQIAGPLEGAGIWNRAEWFPRIVASSRHLGALPDHLGGLNAVDWIPVDVLARIITEVAAAPDTRRERDDVVYNLTGTSPVPYQTVLPTLREALGGAAIELVSAADWCARLAASAPDGASPSGDAQTNPGVKLLEFYRENMLVGPGVGEGKVHHERLVGASRTAREMGPIGADEIKRWVARWA